MAAARAFAALAGVPLWRFLTPQGVAPRLPVPHFNVVNGGVHAPNSLDFQEFMIAPLGAPSVAEAVRAGAEVYAALRARLARAGHATGLGDEGGFAPDITAPAGLRGSTPRGARHTSHGHHGRAAWIGCPIVALLVEVPGQPIRRLEYLLLDVNGTLTDRGVLLPGVAERVAALRAVLRVSRC